MGERRQLPRALGDITVISTQRRSRLSSTAYQCFANPYDYKEAALMLVIEGGIGKEVAGLIRKGRKQQGWY